MEERFKMEKKKKFIIYMVLLSISVISFVLQIFVFEKPNGILGLILCLVSIYLAIGSVIKLCKLSERFKGFFIGFVDLLFWLP